MHINISNVSMKHAYMAGSSNTPPEDKWDPGYALVADHSDLEAATRIDGCE
jgi:hypothetical protein